MVLTLIIFVLHAVSIPFPFNLLMAGRAHATHITSPLLNFHEQLCPHEHSHVAKVLTFTGMFS